MPNMNELVTALLKKGIKAEKVISRKKLFANLLSPTEYNLLADKGKNKLN